TDMNVLINGSTVLQHFNISTAAGGALKGYMQSFPATVSNGTIRIDFNSNWPAWAGWNDLGAVISGIEILSVQSATLSVSPTAASVLPGATQQFTASLGGQPYTNVNWTAQPIGT